MKKALYRAYRPKTFDEVLGQKSIVDVLKNQVKNDQLGHAYLFSGTRGTGKTSCAKILSRAVNCLKPRDGNPCNECENCRAILEEETMDVVEMDAASNRRIDDIRDLREKVIYPPSHLKYKVYIIDEAHMITNEGFNALLKIMEEPPDHLIFILATTEIEKIPQTILSRVQRFEFKRLDPSVIEENIRFILNDQGIEMDDQAISLIARKGDGAMRDALSTLDQVFSLDKSFINIDDVNEIIGSLDRDSLNRLVKSIGRGEKKESLDQISYIIKEGKPPYSIAEEILSYYMSLMHIKVLGYEEDVDDRSLNDLEDVASSFQVSQIIDSIRIIQDSLEKMRTSDFQDSLLEILVLDLIDLSGEDLLSRLSSVERRLDYLENLLSKKKMDMGGGHYHPLEKGGIQEEKLEIERDLARKDFVGDEKDGKIDIPEENDRIESPGIPAGDSEKKEEKGSDPKQREKLMEALNFAKKSMGKEKEDQEIEEKDPYEEDLRRIFGDKLKIN